jgi:hypothetical protein
VPKDVLPFGGEMNGKAAIKDHLKLMFQQFDTLEFAEDIVRVEDDQVTVRVAYCFRHKATRETIEGSLRLIVKVNHNNLIAELSSFHDVERMRVFMQLVAHSADPRCI